MKRKAHAWTNYLPTITRPRLEGNRDETTVNEAVLYAALPIPSTVLRALENTMNSSDVGMSIMNLHNMRGRKYFTKPIHESCEVTYANRT